MKEKKKEELSGEEELSWDGRWKKKKKKRTKEEDGL